MTVALPINIDSLLRRRTIESERVEYKAGWNPESVLHTLGAFANDFHNLGGGYVVLGVEERDGRPVLPPKGLDPDVIDGIQKEMLNLGNSAIQPPYHPLTVVHEIDGKTILVLYAPGGETRPYRTRVSLSAGSREWAYHIRKHSSTVRARGEDELLGLAATVPFDDRYHQNASLDDLSFRLIQQHLQDVGSDLLLEVAEAVVGGSGTTHEHRRRPLRSPVSQERWPPVLQRPPARVLPGDSDTTWSGFRTAPAATISRRRSFAGRWRRSCAMRLPTSSAIT